MFYRLTKEIWRHSDDDYSQNLSHFRVFPFNRQFSTINQCDSSVNTIFATSECDHKQLVNSKLCMHARNKRTLAPHASHRTSMQRGTRSEFITQAFLRARHWQRQSIRHKNKCHGRRANSQQSSKFFDKLNKKMIRDNLWHSS